MRLSHFALAACLFALPIAATATFSTAAYAATTLSELGDLSAMRAIVADTLALVAANDLAGAKAKIAENETAWDNAAGDLHATSAPKWDAIDAASDGAIEALRAEAPAEASRRRS